MQFDPGNSIIKLCAQGMTLEGEGKPEEALELYQQAWNEATSDFEKFTAAHYVARHQQSVADKLKWDETALQLALKIDDESLKGTYPSLYLNIAKCYEDLKNPDKATENYRLAFSFANYLGDDPYGKMIKSGINNGLERVTK
jgi:tetratricopeptide (TPR) repeat protein